MTTKPRIIDNLGTEASIRHAKDKEEEELLSSSCMHPKNRQVSCLINSRRNQYQRG